MKYEQFTRKCPECAKDLCYASKKGMQQAHRSKRICGSCRSKKREPRIGEKNGMFGRKGILSPNFGLKRSKETLERMSKSLSGEKNGMFGRKGVLCPSFGRPVSEETRKKLSKLKKGVPLSDEMRKRISEGQIGKKHSDETKRKMRVSKIDYIIEKNGSVRPSYNMDACNYFKQLEEQKNWSGQYAMKGGEYHLKHLGYFVDYYEPTLNIVVEYDEPLHYYVDNTLKIKDQKRMNEIKEFLKCKFYRYNERTKELKEY